jgi:hypothetical protein
MYGFMSYKSDSLGYLNLAYLNCSISASNKQIIYSVESVNHIIVSTNVLESRAVTLFSKSKGCCMAIFLVLISWQFSVMISLQSSPASPPYKAAVTPSTNLISLSWMI